jgi:hypothetical protein
MATGQDPKLNIRIETTADLKAAAEAERAIEGVTEAAAKAQPALEQLGAEPEGLQSTGEAAQETAPAIDSVTEAAEAAAPALEEADEEVKAIEEDMRRLIDAARGTAPAIEGVKDAAGDLGTDTKGAAEAGDELVNLFNELRQSGGPALQILRGAVAATKGGPQAFFGAATGLRGLLALLKSAGPQGAAAAAAFAGITAAVTALHIAAGQSRKSVEDYSKEIDDATDATAKLNESKTTALIAELKALEVQAAATSASLVAVQVQQQAVIDASAQVEVARIAADPTLTPEQRTERTQAVQQSARASREALTQQVGQTQISAAQQAARDAAIRADDAARRQQVAAAERERVATTPDTITAQIQEAQRRQLEALKEASTTTAASVGTLAGPAAQIQREIDDLRTQRKSAEEDRDRNLKRAEDALALATQELAAARAEAAAREQAAQDVATTVQSQRSAREITEGGTQQTEVIQREAAAREADQAAAASAQASADRAALERNRTDAFNQERATRERTGTTDVLGVEKQIRETPVADKAAIEALKQKKLDLIAQQDADLKAIAQRYESAIAAIRATPLPADPVATQNTIIRGGGALPNDGDAAPGLSPVTRPVSPVAPAAGAPAVSQESIDKVSHDLAEPISDITVPPVDTAPVAAAVNNVNTRLQKEIGGFAKETTNAIARISVVLDEHEQRMKVLAARISNKA